MDRQPKPDFTPSPGYVGAIDALKRVADALRGAGQIPVQ